MSRTPSGPRRAVPPRARANRRACRASRAQPPMWRWVTSLRQLSTPIGRSCERRGLRRARRAHERAVHPGAVHGDARRRGLVLRDRERLRGLRDARLGPQRVAPGSGPRGRGRPRRTGSRARPARRGATPCSGRCRRGAASPRPPPRPRRPRGPRPGARRRCRGTRRPGRRSARGRSSPPLRGPARRLGSGARRTWRPHERGRGSRAAGDERVVECLFSRILKRRAFDLRRRTNDISPD